MPALNTNHVDINYGVDFERARERLNDEAGRAFRVYLQTKSKADATPEAVDAARQAYDDANTAFRKLTRHDADTIARILSGGDS